MEKVKFFKKGVDIVNMKKLALMMIFSSLSVVLSAEEYTIQTISAQKASSITPAFEKKVQKSALPSSQKKEGECNIVTVGKYSSIKAAKHDLVKAKTISKDAFVRSMDRTTPKVCESHVATADVKAVVVVERKEEKTMGTPIKKEEPAVTQTETATVAVAPQSVSTPMVSDVKTEPCKSQPCTNVTYVYDRNLAHKSDVQEAIEYYKRSPYYTFKPVSMPQRF